MPNRSNLPTSGPRTSDKNVKSESAPALNRSTYDDRDNDYILSYDPRSNARHQRSEDPDFEGTLDQNRPNHQWRESE
ncbi:hypothetical protein [Asticcacaulis machinosus]|uniref:Uncharacterized protein n=1 Tax=Asticcacaulis machinosus TaxID=2984211 RepID=A0ABT5HJX8_9CAUL|nr:hypothetical protein [Asticcacaulis machinosus]MDC7676546.1 hypothetical protein [Asticcacaulis machinosus]